MTNDEAIALLPDRDEISTFRGDRRRPGFRPAHGYWTRADVVAAIERFGATLDNTVAGHGLMVVDAVGEIHIEMRGG